MKCKSCNRVIGKSVIIGEILGVQVTGKALLAYDKNDVLCCNCMDKEIEEQNFRIERNKQMKRQEQVGRISIEAEQNPFGGRSVWGVYLFPKESGAVKFLGRYATKEEAMEVAKERRNR